MRSINKVIIVGNLTREPEMRQTPSGQPVTTFGVATNRSWVTKDGREQTTAEFHEVVAWARLAELCAQYLHKGKLVYIEGYLKTRSWDLPDGTKRFKTEIIVEDMIMLEKRAKEDGASVQISENADRLENHKTQDAEMMAERTLNAVEIGTELGV